jgi:hypothetical protein
MDVGDIQQQHNLDRLRPALSIPGGRCLFSAARGLLARFLIFAQSVTFCANTPLWQIDAGARPKVAGALG